MPMSCAAYAVLGVQGSAALMSLADIARCAYNSGKGNDITDDAYMDIVSDWAELMVLYGRVDKHPGGAGNADGSLTSAEQCFSIVYFTMALITSLEFLNGWGPVHTGDEFTTGQSKLGNIDDILTPAGVRYGAWLGSGVDTYHELRQQLSALVDAVQVADQQAARIVHRQADQVQQVREELAATKLSLVGLFLFVAAIVWYYNHFLVNAYTAALENGEQALAGLEMAPLPPARQAVVFDEANAVHDRAVDGTLRRVGLNQRYVTEVMQDVQARGGFFLEEYLPLIVLPPCIAAVTAVGVFLSRLYTNGNSNAQDVQKQSAAYETVARGAAAISGGPAASVVRRPAALLSTDSDFSGIALMPGAAEISGQIVKVAGVVDGVQGRCAPVGVFTGDSSGRADGWLIGLSAGLGDRAAEREPLTTMALRRPAPAKTPVAVVVAEEADGAGGWAAAGVGSGYVQGVSVDGGHGPRRIVLRRHSGR